MRKGFLLYTDYKPHINLLSNEEKGTLLDALFAFASNEELPTMTPMTSMAFSFISSQMEKDFDRYEEICEKRRIAGAKGGKQKVANATNCKQNQAKDSNSNQSQANQANINNKKNINNKIKRDNTLPDDVPETVVIVIDHLNSVANTNFKPNNQASERMIAQRMIEGYKLDDFITVIDKKHNEWQGTEFYQHMNPLTLFGDKFEKYLNERKGKGKPKSNVTNFEERKTDWNALAEQLMEN